MSSSAGSSSIPFDFDDRCWNSSFLHAHSHREVLPELAPGNCHRFHCWRVIRCSNRSNFPRLVSRGPDALLGREQAGPLSRPPGFGDLQTRRGIKRLLLTLVNSICHLILAALGDGASVTAAIIAAGLCGFFRGLMASEDTLRNKPAPNPLPSSRIPPLELADTAEGRRNAGEIAEFSFHPSRSFGFGYPVHRNELILQPKSPNNAGKMPVYLGNPDSLSLHPLADPAAGGGRRGLPVRCPVRGCGRPGGKGYPPWLNWDRYQPHYRTLADLLADVPDRSESQCIVVR
jgi:hypothetical protein